VGAGCNLVMHRFYH